MDKSNVIEPSFENVVKSARLYKVMKTEIEETGTDAGYVLWPTVTGYVQLPRGKVTMDNCGIGDRLFVFKGEVTD